MDALGGIISKEDWLDVAPHMFVALDGDERGTARQERQPAGGAIKTQREAWLRAGVVRQFSHIVGIFTGRAYPIAWKRGGEAAS